MVDDGRHAVCSSFRLSIPFGEMVNQRASVSRFPRLAVSFGQSRRDLTPAMQVFTITLCDRQRIHREDSMVQGHEILAVNPRFSVVKESVGRGHHQVVIVDDFYAHPDQVLRLALDLPYTNRFEVVGNFPGVRASVNLDTAHLVAVISELWGARLRPFFTPQPAVFQAITNHNFQLNIGQRQPHIDPDITAMVYLNPAESCVGGTGLFRHRLTGLERLPIEPDQTIRDLADRLELSEEFLESEEGYENFQKSMIFNPLFACRENTYINDGNQFWELVKLIEMKPNRLIVFDGRCFHSQYIRPEHYREGFRVNQILYLSSQSR